jgi:hypothetical protein
MDDFLIQIWAHVVYRKLILTAIVWLAALVLGGVLPWPAISRLRDESPHIHAMPQGQPTPAVSRP